jgi:hypothetical protein
MIVGISPKQVSAACAGTAETLNAMSRTAAAPAATVAQIAVHLMSFPLSAVAILT